MIRTRSNKVTAVGAEGSVPDPLLVLTEGFSELPSGCVPDSSGSITSRSNETALGVLR